MVVTVSHTGYIKRSPLSLYRAQHRGGQGKAAMVTKEEDFVSDLFVASTHDYFLIFTDRGRVFCKKVYNIPLSGPVSKGKALVNLIALDKDEKVKTFMPVSNFDETNFVVFATKNGIVKKTELSLFNSIRSTGIVALLLDDEDELVSAKITNGKQDLFIGTKNGLSIKFSENLTFLMGFMSLTAKLAFFRENFPR